MKVAINSVEYPKKAEIVFMVGLEDNEIHTSLVVDKAWGGMAPTLNKCLKESLLMAARAAVDAAPDNENNTREEENDQSGTD